MCVYVDFLFFFFKQETAYEMRISDWSSDVCSSDLGATVGHGPVREGDSRKFSADDPGQILITRMEPGAYRYFRENRRYADGTTFAVSFYKPHENPEPAMNRSEEHTSELQSLMRISYAVFCLKKKRTQTQQQQQAKVIKNIHA